jgi:cystathionine gamma-lyase
LITQRADLLSLLRFHQNATGSVPSPFDSWLAVRGARTLELRMQRHGLNSLAIARWLDTTARKEGWVTEVIYPGLESSSLWNRQLVWSQLAPEAKSWIEEQGFSVDTGFPFSGMVSVRLHPQVNADFFLSTLKVFVLAESLGGVESLAELPGKMCVHLAAFELADRQAGRMRQCRRKTGPS